VKILSVSSSRFAVDVFLFGLILLMLSPRLTGLPVHEWLGLALGIPVVVHLLLSWSWISRATLVVLEILSGVVISVVALPALGISTIEDGAWRLLHNRFLNFLVILVGVHIAMNWNALRSGIRRWLVRVAE